jgi:hypothetical protein
MVKITEKQKDDCIKYATELIESGKQLNRYNQSKEIQIERTALGKMGEVAFYNLLTKSGIESDYKKILTILPYADSFDFLMPNGNYKIDIKTIKSNHKYLLVPKQQTKKDIYICIKMIGLEANFIGYIWYKDLLQGTDEQLSNKMPEGKCHNCTLDALKDVSNLLDYWYF